MKPAATKLPDNVLAAVDADAKKATTNRSTVIRQIVTAYYDGLFRRFQRDASLTAALSELGPEQFCKGCVYKHIPTDDWCYMFRDPPCDACAQYHQLRQPPQQETT